MKQCPSCKGTYPDHYVSCPIDQTQLTTLSSELAVGQVIRGKYEILSVLGRGGMAIVYKARHKHFREEYALKIVHPQFLHDVGFLKRFRNEAVVVRQLQHPNAVRVHDFDEGDDGRPFIVMELVDGPTVYEARKQASAPWSVDVCVEIACQVADALAAAHALGIVHRDIKPSNVVLLREAKNNVRVKVMDFGIAKVTGTALAGITSVLTEQNLVIGTPEYMSPEQASGRTETEIDGRSDIYSLGVMLYEMAAGTHPFHADTPIGMVLEQLHTVPAPPRTLQPGLPESLSALILKCLEKVPANRFQSADEMLASLRAIRAGDATEREKSTPQPTVLEVMPAIVVPVMRVDTVLDLRKAETAESPRRSTEKEQIVEPAPVKHTPQSPRLEPVLDGPGLAGRRWLILGSLVIAAFFSNAGEYSFQVAQIYSGAYTSTRLLYASLAAILGYALAGVIADRLGSRTSLAIFIGSGALAELIVSFTYRSWFIGVARYCLGLAIAGLWVVAIKATGEIFNQRHRSLALGIFSVGAYAPPKIGMALIDSFGWHTSLVTAGITSLIWIPLWLWVYKVPAAAGPAPVTKLRDVLLRANTWKLMVAVALIQPVSYFYRFLFLSSRGVGYNSSAPSTVFYGTFSRYVEILSWAPSVGALLGGGLCTWLIYRGMRSRNIYWWVMTGASVLGLLSVVAPSWSFRSFAGWIAALIVLASAAWALTSKAATIELYPPEQVGRAASLLGFAGALSTLLYRQTSDWGAYHYWRVCWALALPLAVATAILWDVFREVPDNTGTSTQGRSVENG